MDALTLTNAIGFGVDDLNANRAGELSENQRVFLNRECSFWRLYAFSIPVVAMLLIVLAVADGIQRYDTLASRIGMILLILILAGTFFLYTYVRFKKFRADLEENRISSLVGVVELKSYAQRNGREYIVALEKVQFKINRLTFETFETGSSYRIYYALHSKRIMSAEPVAS